MAGLLEGLVVLDLTWGMAGPFAGMLLADNGADIIKIEPPGGDPFRFQPAYHTWNRGKRSLVLDLKTEAGRERLFRLAEKADVLIESFQPGTADRLGVGYEAMARRCPHLIYGSISGYGPDEARKNEPGYEHLVDAWLGVTSEVQSYRGHPAFNAFPIGSYGAGQLMTMGVLAAAQARESTGQGQHVETSLVDGTFILGTMYWAWSEKPTPRNNFNTVGPTLPRRHLMSLGVLECSDGKQICIHTGPPGRFAAALSVLGILDKVTPAAPNVEKNAPLTEEERSFLLREVPRIIKSKPRDHWTAAFEKADVCCLPVDAPGVAFKDPQAVHEGVVVTLQDPEMGPITVVGPVLKADGKYGRVVRPAPRVGEGGEAAEAALLARPSRAFKVAGSIKHPLQGIRIIDFGSYFAGPAASKMLSDLGAEVIKVEPLQGDTLRGTPNGFRPAQRGKRSLAIDGKTTEGRDIVLKLVREADAVTHNMRPGAAERMGIGYEQLAAIRPQLIYLHSPGFGGDGPRAHLQGFAPLLSNMCGLQAQGAGKGNAPLLNWITNEDQTGGCLGAIWLLMGLYYRNRTGKGVKLEGSLFNTALMAASEVILDPTGKPLSRFEIDQQQMGYNALTRLYQTRDGWIMLVVMLDPEWKGLTQVDGLTGLAGDRRFADRQSRQSNDAALIELLSSWFGARRNAEALAALRARRVPCEVPQDDRMTRWFQEEANLANGRVVAYRHEEYGQLRETGHSIRFSSTPGLIRGPSPMLGEHTRAILGELGCDEAATEGLRARGVVTWKGAAGAKQAIG